MKKKLMKILIPLIVTADGKWATMSSYREEVPDWGAIDEHVDYENPTIIPQRYLVEAIIEIPEIKIAVGRPMPQVAQ